MRVQILPRGVPPVESLRGNSEKMLVFPISFKEKLISARTIWTKYFCKYVFEITDLFDVPTDIYEMVGRFYF